MDERIIHKFINKFKDKFTKPKITYNEISEYAFSLEELEDINKQNKQKIQELKQDIIPKKKEYNIKPSTDEVLSKIETDINYTDEVTEPIANIDTNLDNLDISKEEEIEEKVVEPPIEEVNPKNSFINLNQEYQKLIMAKWNEIQQSKIDKDIINGKDLLNHNYTITFADDAARFIHYIRKEYEVVICYLIGFNNEKQGIYDKTIFSDKIDNEWKYLSSYIKMLEKIRKNK